MNVGDSFMEQLEMETIASIAKPDRSNLIIGFTGERYVGKSTIAGLMIHYGFEKLHTFGPGLDMCYHYYVRLGIEQDIAYRMVYTDLKDVPCDKLPGGVTSRFFMEQFGYFLGTVMGPAWTLGVEIDRMQRLFPDRPLAVESVVYEADYFRQRGGKIVRILRDRKYRPEGVTGEKTDEAQANIIADAELDNNGSIEQLRVNLENLLMNFGMSRDSIRYYRR